MADRNQIATPGHAPAQGKSGEMKRNSGARGQRPVITMACRPGSVLTSHRRRLQVKTVRPAVCEESFRRISTSDHLI